MDRRFLLLAAAGLIVAAITLGAWSFTLQPHGRGATGFVALQGPFATQYDPTNDTTLVVQECFYCSGPGYIVKGNETNAFGGSAAYIEAPPGAWVTVNASGPAHRTGEAVTTAFAGPFIPTTLGWRPAPALLAPVLACAGVGLALTRTRAGALAYVSAGVLAAAVVWNDLVILAFTAALAGILVGIGLLLSPRTRRYALAPVLFAASFWWLLFAIGGFFPHGAEL